MDDDQQFCLRWNNHQSTLVAVFDTLLENGTLVDCTLAAEGRCLNAHKVVLSACSPYFEALLSRHFDKHPILILKDVKFQELKAMMDYMYRGEVNISQDQLGALLKAAESLQIKGLSDNKKGESEKKPAPQPLPPKSPQPTSALPKVQGLTIEQRSRDDSREGSQSPGPRKKKRLRRKSEELDNHDASNSSESHSLPAQNIPSLPTVSKLNADVPEPVETKSEILTRHKPQEEIIPQVPIIKEKIETHTELMLEPKSEYVEEMNEDSIEDLTLDDDDISNMEQMDDGAGPSHGNAGEGSSQDFTGFGGWHMGNQSQDEVFLAAQEAVGAHRDSQGCKIEIDDVHLPEFLKGENIETGEEIKEECYPEDASLEKPLCKAEIPENPGTQTTISKKRKHKRIRSRDFCYFCDKYVFQFARHIQRHHISDSEVGKIFDLPAQSKERKELLCSLRKRSNFVKHSQGFIKPLRKTSNINQRNYAHCKYCLGVYTRKYLWKHLKKCTEKKEADKVETTGMLKSKQTKRKLSRDIGSKMKKSLNITKDTVGKESGKEIIENYLAVPTTSSPLLDDGVEGNTKEDNLVICKMKEENLDDCKIEEGKFQIYESCTNITQGGADYKANKNLTSPQAVKPFKTSLSKTSHSKGELRKQVIRVAWTTEQKELTEKFFSSHIRRRKAPKKFEIEIFKNQYEGIFDNKTWPQIKVFVQNTYTKRL